MAKKTIDALTGTETTGHSWDGIEELNNPLPRWWLWTFYLTIIWSLGYYLLYPAWPTVSGYTKGLLGYSSRAELAREMAAHKASQAKFVAQIKARSLEEIRTDRKLYSFAVKGGRSAYLVNCSQCHGSGATGFPGYPNLNDDDWLWGGSLEEIFTTIAHGIRFAGDEDTRESLMPGFAEDLSRQQIADVTEYVLSLAGRSHEAAAAERGKALYEDNCAACHGDNGEGDQSVGAPKLADGITLFGGTRADIRAQIVAPRHGVMPAWAQRLDEVTLKQLALYVHGLGGGK